MFRKLVFIFFTVLSSMQIQQKSVILLFFSSLSLVYTIHSKPFVLNSLNILDVNSNYTILFTLFAGALYISQISEGVRLLIFSIIVVFNTIFVIKWAFGVFEIVTYTYEKNIQKFCPFLLLFIMIVKKTSQETKFTIFIPNYIFWFVKNFLRNRREYRLN